MRAVLVLVLVLLFATVAVRISVANPDDLSVSTICDAGGHCYQVVSVRGFCRLQTVELGLSNSTVSLSSVVKKDWRTAVIEAFAKNGSVLSYKLYVTLPGGYITYGCSFVFKEGGASFVAEGGCRQVGYHSFATGESSSGAGGGVSFGGLAEDVLRDLAYLSVFLIFVVLFLIYLELRKRR